MTSISRHPQTDRRTFATVRLPDEGGYRLPVSDVAEVDGVERPRIPAIDPIFDSWARVARWGRADPAAPLRAQGPGAAAPRPARPGRAAPPGPDQPARGRPAGRGDGQRTPRRAGGAGRRRAHAAVRVVSAAYGLLHLRDAVPAHRLSMGGALPGVGPLAAAWRPHLAAELDPLAAEGEVVVDARSAACAAAWAPPREHAHRLVVVSVVAQAPSGARTVVSHATKRARGLLARHLVTRGGRAPRDVEAVAAAAAEAFSVELDDPAPGRSRRLTVVLATPG